MPAKHSGRKYKTKFAERVKDTKLKIQRINAEINAEANTAKPRLNPRIIADISGRSITKLSSTMYLVYNPNSLSSKEIQIFQDQFNNTVNTVNTINASDTVDTPSDSVNDSEIVILAETHNPTPPPCTDSSNIAQPAIDLCDESILNTPQTEQITNLVKTLQREIEADATYRVKLDKMIENNWQFVMCGYE